MLSRFLYNPARLESDLEQAQLMHDAGRWAEAERLYRKVAAANPRSAATHNNFARLLLDQGRPEEAANMFRSATDLQPGNPLTLHNLGVALCKCDRLEEAFAAFRREAELTFVQEQKSPTEALPHKVRHDAEQAAFLRRQSLEEFHIEEATRVPDRAINYTSFPSDLAQRWANATPRVLVIDNLLTDEALDKMRRYCMGSTIWRRVYKAGYLGAMAQHGLGSPLLAQIVDELRAACPFILGKLPLNQFWGFKYDSRMEGVALHADFAAVNVNFWIAPDDANNDPDGGGLVLWDVPAPLEWDFSNYNDNADAARAWLERCSARPTNVPHRANRAVIFDSNLFHETGKIDFKDGYANRRVNITLLFGNRETSSPFPES